MARPSLPSDPERDDAALPDAELRRLFRSVDARRESSQMASCAYGLVLRNLPPFARIDTFPLSDGSTLYVEEWEKNSDGSIRYRRGATWATMQLAGQ